MRMLSFGYCLLLLLFSWGCNPDEDETPPSITLIQPSENSVYNIYDDIIIEADVADNNKLTAVTVRVRSSASQAVILEVKSFSPQSKRFQLRTNIEIQDSLLQEINYEVEIEAKDGENEFSIFRPIRINPLVKERLGTVVCIGNANSASLLIDNSEFNFQNAMTFSNPFGHSILSNDNQHFWFLPKNESRLEVYSFKEKGIVYSENYNSNFTETFVDIDRLDRAIYIARKAEIDGFNNRLGNLFTYVTRTQRKLNCFGVSEDRILAHSNDFQGNNGELLVIGNSGGNLLNAVNFPADPVEMFIYDGTESVIFYNQNNRGVIGDFTLNTAGYRETEFLSEAIIDAIRVNDSEYLLSTKSGIYLYDVRTEVSTKLKNATKPVIFYDEVDNLVYYGEGLQLRAFSLPMGVDQNIASFNAEIKSIAVLYNRD